MKPRVHIIEMQDLGPPRSSRVISRKGFIDIGTKLTRSVVAMSQKMSLAGGQIVDSDGNSGELRV